RRRSARPSSAGTAICEDFDQAGLATPCKPLLLISENTFPKSSGVRTSIGSTVTPRGPTAARRTLYDHANQVGGYSGEQLRFRVHRFRRAACPNQNIASLLGYRDIGGV